MAKQIITFIAKEVMPLFLALSLAGCATQGMKQDQDALYYRMGARKELGKIATDTVDFWTGDQRLIGNAAVRAKLQHTDSNGLKRNYFNFLCWSTNGPCEFKGDFLANEMQGLGITNLEWFYLLEGVVNSLNKHNVPIREQNELLAIIYALQVKVVGQ